MARRNLRREKFFQTFRSSLFFTPRFAKVQPGVPGIGELVVFMAEPFRLLFAMVIHLHPVVKNPVIEQKFFGQPAGLALP